MDWLHVVGPARGFRNLQTFPGDVSSLRLCIYMLLLQYIQLLLTVSIFLSSLEVCFSVYCYFSAYTLLLPWHLSVDLQTSCWSKAFQSTAELAPFFCGSRSGITPCCHSHQYSIRHWNAGCKFQAFLSVSREEVWIGKFLPDHAMSCGEKDQGKKRSQTSYPFDIDYALICML